MFTWLSERPPAAASRRCYLCPRCGVDAATLELLSLATGYFACDRCGHRWMTERGLLPTSSQVSAALAQEQTNDRRQRREGDHSSSPTPTPRRSSDEAPFRTDEDAEVPNLPDRDDEHERRDRRGS